MIEFGFLSYVACCMGEWGSVHSDSYSNYYSDYYSYHHHHYSDYHYADNHSGAETTMEDAVCKLAADWLLRPGMMAEVAVADDPSTPTTIATATATTAAVSRSTTNTSTSTSTNTTTSTAISIASPSSLPPRSPGMAGPCVSDDPSLATIDAPATADTSNTDNPNPNLLLRESSLWLHGFEIPWKTPVVWLAQHLSYADNFLHVVLHHRRRHHQRR